MKRDEYRIGYWLLGGIILSALSLLGMFTCYGYACVPYLLGNLLSSYVFELPFDMTGRMLILTIINSSFYFILGSLLVYLFGFLRRIESDKKSALAFMYIGILVTLIIYFAFLNILSIYDIYDKGFFIALILGTLISHLLWKFQENHRIVILIILVFFSIQVVILFGSKLYIEQKNAAILEHPTYVPSQIVGPPLDLGTESYSPIINYREYFYNCKNKMTSIGLNIDQYRIVEKTRDTNAFYNKNFINTNIPHFFGWGTFHVNGQSINLSPENFTIIDSQYITRDGKTFLFEEFISPKIPESLFQLRGQTDKVNYFINTDSYCLSKDIAADEMVKMVESMY